MKCKYRPVQIIQRHSAPCKPMQRCFFEYTNIVNNTDSGARYGVIHFDGTSANMSHVIIINNTGFSFTTYESDVIKATECYSDIGSNYVFINTTGMTPINDYQLSYRCELPPSSALYEDRRSVLFIISVVFKK